MLDDEIKFADPDKINWKLELAFYDIRRKTGLDFRTGYKMTLEEKETFRQLTYARKWDPEHGVIPTDGGFPYYGRSSKGADSSKWCFGSFQLAIRMAADVEDDKYLKESLARNLGELRKKFKELRRQVEIGCAISWLRHGRAALEVESIKDHDSSLPYLAPTEIYWPKMYSTRDGLKTRIKEAVNDLQREVLLKELKKLEAEIEAEKLRIRHEKDREHEEFLRKRRLGW